MSPKPSPFTFLPPSSIQVNRPDRQRRDVDTAGLLESIKNLGILNPLIVTKEGVLVAGERRLTTALELGLPEVPVRYLEDLPNTTLQIIELEENLKRRDLSWQDAVSAAGRIHGLFLAEDPEWTMSESASQMGISIAAMSGYLQVFAGLEDPVISGAGTLGEARNILLRRRQREGGMALQELLDLADASEAPPAPSLESFFPEGMPQGTCSVPDFGPDVLLDAGEPVPLPGFPWAESPTLDRVINAPGAPEEPPQSILTADFLKWAPLYTGPKFNLLHCDFPYGLNVFSAEQMSAGRHGSYDDSPDVYWALIRGLCANLDRLLSVSAHVVFWFSEKHRDATLALFRDLAPSIVWTPFPLVWFKTDNMGIAGDVRRHPRHVYETALFGSRGGRNLVGVKADCYGAPTNKLLHASTKPEPMLRHFFSMVVDEHTELLDPTCGSGASLRAAESLGAKRVQGLELDAKNADLARGALHAARQMRSIGG